MEKKLPTHLPPVLGHGVHGSLDLLLLLGTRAVDSLELVLQSRDLLLLLVQAPLLHQALVPELFDLLLQLRELVLQFDSVQVQLALRLLNLNHKTEQKTLSYSQKCWNT